MENNLTDTKNIKSIYFLNNYIRSLFISENLELKLKVPTLSFVNIQEPDEREPGFNNKRKLNEIKILKKHNPENYLPYVFKNKTHFIFNKKQPANKIISIIKENL